MWSITACTCASFTFECAYLAYNYIILHMYVIADYVHVRIILSTNQLLDTNLPHVHTCIQNSMSNQKYKISARYPTLG